MIISKIGRWSSLPKQPNSKAAKGTICSRVSVKKVEGINYFTFKVRGAYNLRPIQKNNLSLWITVRRATTYPTFIVWMNIYQKYKTDYRTNLKLALPIMIGQLGQVTVNIADNVMVGRLGPEALASVGLGIAVFAIFLIFGMGISFALPPVVSEADGQGNRPRISHMFKHSLLQSFHILRHTGIWVKS